MNINFIPLLSTIGIFVNGILIHDNTVKNRLYTKKLNRLSRLESLTILYLSDKYKYKYKRHINKEELNMSIKFSNRTKGLAILCAASTAATVYHNHNVSNGIEDVASTLVENVSDRIRSGAETVATIAENVTTEM